MPPQAGAKKQPLTLAQVSQYDDLLTDALVDHVYYWTTIPKNRPSYHATRGVTEEEITKIIQTHLIVDTDFDLAEEKLLQTAGLRKFLNGLRTPKEKDDFRRHLRRYMQIHLPDCPFEVSSTNRYTIVTQEAAVTARQFIKKGQAVKYLSGIQVLITPEEERELSYRKKDFSIVVSSRSKCASLFMGPARFANHDCGANARLMITSQACIEIIAVRNIEVGDEITVQYGDNYFGENNCECLCQTCENNLVNGWRQSEEAGAVKKSIENLPLEGYSLRHKRRGDSCASDSRTPSLGPEIRPRILKTRSKLSRTDSGNFSAIGSPAADSSSQKRKRGNDSLKTPPITPAKRLKSLQASVTPLVLPQASSRHSSENQSIGAPSASDSDGVSTDVTTPEVEDQLASFVKDTDSATISTSASRTVKLFNPMSIESIMSSTIFDSIEMSQNSNSSDPPSASSVSASTTVAAAPVTPPASMPQDAPPSPATTESPAVDPARGRGRTQSRKRAVSSASSDAATVILSQPTKSKWRTPGDYTLTPVLLSEANTAWIHCMNCSEAFVQHNAYYTRSSCPRCERHSKLYGYLWPKTAPEGKHDKEERILDHRTIHRFLDRQGEARVRGRQLTVVEAQAEANSDKTAKAKRSVSLTAGARLAELSAHRRSSAIPAIRRSRSGRVITSSRFSDDF
ncbi:hypothetical protein Micbo1qcDRAFT_138118 [Microdochium bolleyi]|uniref:Histone-lysine N-methyltransferase SET9 n=1 Tax=Microdochium bolleyi TaxID=196109 RepID=A0A136IVJ4_9PEZI|nr:hypothetical protein Micbo1qcDRAFT_138118 [Microdochium bolleyi]